MGRLFLVATPIGNLEELSPRARRVLGEVDVVLAEDTRRTGALLHRMGISAKMRSYHLHNEEERTEAVVAELVGELRAALVTDAGTPGISDPGARLVRRAREAGVAIESVAGPSALAAALAAAGFEAEPALFLGFPPARSGERKRFFEQWRATPTVVVLYEAPHRIERSLADLAEVMGAGRRAILLRELTKLHEEGIDGTLGSLLAEVRERDGLKGEIVLVLDRPSAETADASVADPLVARVAELVADGADRREALKRAARELGLGRAEAYRRLQAAGVEP